MVNYLRYASPVAYTRAHFPYLLDEDVWFDLLQASSVNRLLQRLETTDYGEAIALTDRESPDLSQIEKAIKSHQAEASRAPFLFLEGRPLELLEWQWRRFEIDNLKIILRGLHQQASDEVIGRSLIELEVGSTTDWQSLIESSSIDVLLEDLEGTPYASMLRPAMKQYREENDLFYLEIALDLGYNRRLKDAIDSLRFRDHKEATRFVGSLIDSRLIIWSFRFREFGQMEPEQIINFTLNEGYQVTDEHIQQIALGAGVEGILDKVLGPSVYEDINLSEMPIEEAIAELEIIFQRHRYQQARTVRRKPSFHLGLLLAYEALLEAEVLDLITLIEGIAADWPLARIRPHLIGERGTSV